MAHEFKVQCINLKRLFLFLKGAIRASESSQLGYDKVGSCVCMQVFILAIYKFVSDTYGSIQKEYFLCSYCWDIFVYLSSFSVILIQSIQYRGWSPSSPLHLALKKQRKDWVTFTFILSFCKYYYRYLGGGVISFTMGEGKFAECRRLCREPKFGHSAKPLFVECCTRQRFALGRGTRQRKYRNNIKTCLCRVLG